MFILASMLFMQLFSSCFCQYEEYQRELRDRPKLNQTVKHTIKLLDKMEQLIKSVRKRILTVNFTSEPGPADIKDTLLEGIEHMFQMQARVAYCLHLLRSSGLRGFTMANFKNDTNLHSTYSWKKTSTTTPRPKKKFVSEALMTICEGASMLGDADEAALFNDFNKTIKDNEHRLPGRMYRFLISIMKKDENKNINFKTKAAEYASFMKSSLPDFIRKADDVTGFDEVRGGALLRTAAHFHKYSFSTVTVVNNHNITHIETGYQRISTILDRFLTLFEYANLTGAWVDYEDDCRKLIRYETKGDLRIRRGYLTEALLRLTSTLQEMSDEDLDMFLGHYKDVVDEYLKLYKLHGTNLEMFLRDRLQFNESKIARVFSRLYYDEINDSDYDILQRGDETLRRHEIIGITLLETIDKLQNFQDVKDGDPKELCRQIVSLFLRTFYNLEKSNTPLERHNLRESLRQGKAQHAVVFIFGELKSLEKDLLYIEYVLNLNGI